MKHLRRKQRRFDGRWEVAIGLGVYAVYLTVRAISLRGGGRARAARNARKIVATEERLGIHVEPQLQRHVLPYRRLLHALNVGYVTLNVVLTIGFLLVLFFRRHPEFHRIRRGAVLTTLGAQPFFLFFPTAPPRTLDHLVDTMQEVSQVDLDRGIVSMLYHPLAAFPSIHVAWAVVTAAGLRQSQNRLVRAAAPAYPPVVALVVFVTANHYVLDAVAGGTLGAIGMRLARRLGS